MTINDDYKVIFIHIPKCAGTQLQNEIFIQNKKYKTRLHASIQEIKKIYYNEYLNYFKFAIIRNPYDRFVSAYFYLKNTGPFDKFNTHLKDEIINNDLYTFAENLYINKNLQNIIHFIPMYTFVCDDNENIIVNKIIYFENINEEINNLLNNFNINIKFKKTTSSCHYNYEKYLTKRLIHIINDIYIAKN